MHHVVTGLLLLAAFFAQGYGSAVGSALLIGLGIGIEAWFWARTVRQRREASAKGRLENGR